MSAKTWTRWTVVGLALAAAAGCHWPSPAEREGARIAARNAEARGGLAAWRAIRTMSVAGSLDAGTPRDPVRLAASYLRPRSEVKAQARRAAGRRPGSEEAKPLELPFTMELARPRRSRVEVRFKDQPAVQVYDGSQGWKVRPFLGRHEVEPFSAEELRVAAMQADLDGPLLDASAKGSRVELEGTEPVGGRPAYRLLVTTSSGQARRVWVDAESYLDVQVDGSRRLDGKPRTVLTRLEDYRKVGGVMVPHLLVTSAEGVPAAERIQVEKVTINPQLADARFQRPE